LGLQHFDLQGHLFLLAKGGCLRFFECSANRLDLLVRDLEGLDLRPKLQLFVRHDDQLLLHDRDLLARASDDQTSGRDRSSPVVTDCAMGEVRSQIALQNAHTEFVLRMNWHSDLSL
jgi:hypothetical protein